MKKLLVALGVASLFVAGVAQAADAPVAYAELGYTGLTVGTSGSNYSPSAVRVIGGYNLNEFVAVEGLAAMNLADADVGNVSGVAIKGKISKIFGAYVKPQYNITPELQVFGRLGYAQTTATVTASGNNVSASADSTVNSFSYGAGAAYAITPNVYANLDYMVYATDKDNAQAKGWTLGVGYRF